MAVDPYVYPGTNLLRNKLGLHDRDLLEVAERRLGQYGLARLAAKPLRMPIGVARLKATHKAIFGEVYEWAGQFRENLGAMQKYRPAGYPVVYPPSTYIPQEMDRVFAELKNEKNLVGRPLGLFAARTAVFYGEMDGIHPFREGNSRTLRQFFYDLALAAGYELSWTASAENETTRQALYFARDEAAMKRKYEPLQAILRAGLKPR